MEQVTSQGLTSHEAKLRLKKYGLNVLVTSKKRSEILNLLAKFANPLILILLFASFLSAVTGEVVDFLIIFSIIVVSVIIDFYREYQSEKAVEELKKKVAIKTEVLRDGEKKEILASHITVGDIVFLSAGDMVSADIKILYFKDLHVDESSLTGESFPVEKKNNDSLLMGTTIVNGEATGEVLKIGKETEFGKIAEKLSVQRPETDFEKGIKNFGILVLKVTLVLVFFIFLANVFFKHEIFQSLLFALALAVGLTPELLPMIVTVNLAKGASRLVSQGVIVKHLPSIQNLGSMDILCTDKTGTITENKIELERYENFQEKEDLKVLHFVYLNSFFQSNLKNPLDEAVLKHKEVSYSGFEKIDEIPFDFERKSLSVVIESKDKRILISKGAPQNIFELCDFYEDENKVIKLDQTIKKKINKRYEQLSSEGFRVLAVGYKNVDKHKKIFEKDEEKHLIFLGLTAFLDPPKKEVKEILQNLTKKGVDLKILTGDNELVTKKICQELNIPIKDVFIGKELSNLSDDALLRLVSKGNIFARLSPDNKHRIISVLRKAGFVVGYLGDGVNDATSLKAADIGISVDNAVDVAKDAADIILLKKSLKVLSYGIVEGRKTFVNTLKYIFIGMGSNFGNMLSVSISSLFLPFLPMLPTQILLNNFIYDLSQVTIPTDNVDVEDTDKPQKWDTNFIKRFMIIFGPASSLFDFITFITLIFIFRSTPPFFRTGWFVESIVTQSLIIFAFRTKKVPFFLSKPSKYLFLSVLAGVFAGIFISYSFFGSFFQFTPLPFLYWIFLTLVVIGYFTLVEIMKLWFYRSLL